MEIRERVRLVRKDAGLNREDFAKTLGFKSDGAVANMELGRTEINQERIDLICDVHKVNKEWLLYGIGDMHNPKSYKEQIYEFADQVIKAEDSSIKKRLITALSRLEPQQWDALQKFLDGMDKGED